MTNFSIDKPKGKEAKKCSRKLLLAILDSKSISNRVDQDEF